MKRVFFYLAVMLIIAGCSSQQSDNSNIDKELKGYYVDDAIVNVDYSCGKYQGKTDKEGIFKFEEGKDCKLSIANITLQNVPANVLKDGIVIFENNLTIATFLQSIDSKSDDNKLIIDSKVEELLKELNIKEVPSDLNELIEKLNQKLKNDNITLKVKTSQEVLSSLKNNYQDYKNRPLYLTNNNVPLDNNTNSDKNLPSITLKGDNPLLLEVGSNYIEPGFSALDNIDGDLSNSVEVESNIDTTKLGTYSIVYSVKDSIGNKATVRRVVKVIDTKPPVIEIKGDKNITLEYLQQYKEEGFEASDNYDGNLTNKVVVTNSVDYSKLGTYTIVYSVEDSSKNRAEATRVINIVDTKAPTIALSKESNITLEIGEPYTEPGFKAEDNYDGDITSKVKIEGSVDTNIVGTYTLTYIIEDSSKNRVEVKRYITIVDSYAYIPKDENLDYDITFRFLEKASFGPTPTLIKEVQQKGIESWLDEQLNVSYDKNDSLTYQLVRMGAILNDFAYKYPIEDYLDPNTEHILPPKGADQEKYKQYFISSWFREVFWSPKQVHMRVAYALSQIVVASSSSGLFNGQHHALAAYYDVIKKNALGNYGDLLKEMSSNPAMGNYLTFYGNKKKYQNNRGEWVYPDENYAREIMQLFSIGPFLLNSDGSKILDAKGRPVPSYTQDDVNEMARVFTGLDFRKARGEFGNTGLRYGDLIHKMVCFDEYHDSEPKTILGKTIPGGNCYDDIDAAVDVLISHQNAAPFISRKLIMRLVKSNPSLEYIQRVATVFRDTNGNLKETVRAIYLDPELWDDIKNKRIEKYKEPIIAFTQMARVLNVKPLPKWHLIIDSPSAKEVKNKTVHVEDKDIIYIPYGGFGQMPTMAKSVFNFYSDDYIPNDSYFRDNNLVAPEIEIQTDGQLVAYHNFMYDILNYEKNYALNRKGLNLYHPYKLKVYKNLKEYGEDLDTIYHPFRLYFDLTKYIKVVEDAFREEIKDKNLTQIDGKDLEEIFDNAHEKSYRFSEETRRKAINGMLDIIDKELLGHTMSPKFREVMIKKFAYELREYRSEDFRRFYFLVVQHLIQKTVILDDYKVE